MKNKDQELDKNLGNYMIPIEFYNVTKILIKEIHTCRRGHIMSGENIYTSPNGREHCKTCRKLNREKNFKPWYERRRINDPDWRRKIKLKLESDQDIIFDF